MASASGRVTRRHPVLRIEGERSVRRPDRLAVEEPLEIRVDGEALAVTMRTPGADFEADLDLIHGYLFAESVVDRADDIVTARYCDGLGPDGLNTYNVLDVLRAAHLPPVDPGLRRNVLTTSACGVCGSTSIDQVVAAKRYPLPSDLVVDQRVVSAAPQLLRERQKTFDKTGGLHGAGLLSSTGELLCVREDVGRHNAVDKVVGWALRQDRLPLSDALLVVSGRASFELTQKAILAGIGMLVAVSAPSSLAVELAAEAGLTLVGFVRGDSMNVYTAPERVRLLSDPPAGSATTAASGTALATSGTGGRVTGS